ncbi:MAG: nucleotidyl transferase AbiEii/AbiGii toxin family protein [Candidatus Aenigmarchaeota archaeon]|nr:nucleotidyl transferase AbiEii/AbiGii toxin family protein [Candidatus Aenigmarchaeota archaeon]
MLTQDELKKYAFVRRIKLIDHVWKDYMQDLVLYLLYKKMPKLVFNGGTLIWKTMKGDRFSEDIDACNASIPFDIDEYLAKELRFFGIDCKIEKIKKTENMLFLKLLLSHPSHSRNIIISVEILVGRPEETMTETIFSPYPDIPPVEIIAVSPRELMANKISAIYRRNKARDVHDIYFLLKSGIKIDMDLIKKKAPTFSIKTFESKMLEKQTEWKSLMPLIITKLPSLKEEIGYILSCFARYGIETNDKE